MLAIHSSTQVNHNTFIFCVTFAIPNITATLHDIQLKTMMHILAIDISSISYYPQIYDIYVAKII